MGGSTTHTTSARLMHWPMISRPAGWGDRLAHSRCARALRECFRPTRSFVRLWQAGAGVLMGGMGGGGAMSGVIVVFVMIRRPPLHPSHFYGFLASVGGYFCHTVESNLVYTLVPRTIPDLLCFLGRAGRPSVVPFNFFRCPQRFHILLCCPGRTSVRLLSLSILSRVARLHTSAARSTLSRWLGCDQFVSVLLGSGA